MSFFRGVMVRVDEKWIWGEGGSKKPENEWTSFVHGPLSLTDEYEYFSLKKPESPEQGRTPYKNTKLQSKTYNPLTITD